MQVAELFSIPVDDDGEATRIVRTGATLIVAFLGGFLAWASLAPLHGAVLADGIIKVDNNRKTVQHLDGGIVKRLLVQEGTMVAKGQPLVVLEDTLSSSNLNIVIDQLNALKAKEARLLTEASLKSKVDYPKDLVEDASDKVRALLRNEDALFQSKRRTLTDQMQLIEHQISEANSAIRSYSSEITAIEEGIRYAGEQVSASRNLLKKGYIEKTQLWAIQTALAEKKERLGEVKGQIALQRENVSELKLRIINLRNEYAKQADDELKQTKNDLYEQEERFRPAKDAQQRQSIDAPIAGQVINLRVTTVGGVIKPGEALMDIVPMTPDLILEARVNTKDIDSVHVGQPAEIQLSAFNQGTTPLVKGEIIYVSGDALVDEHLTPPQSYYLIHVRADKESLSQLGHISLAPGMPVTTYVQTKARTLAEYLLSPLVERSRKTFRED